MIFDMLSILHYIQHIILLQKFQTNKNFDPSHLTIHDILTLETL